MLALLLRDGVLLCAAAKVLGNVEIGRDAKVGAGSVVLHAYRALPSPAWRNLAFL